MRRGIAAISLVTALIAGCGESGPSLRDYVESLNTINDEFSRRGEAIWMDYLQITDPAIAVLRVLVETSAALRAVIQTALDSVALRPQLAEMHAEWSGWHARLLAAEQAEARRTAAVAGRGEFVANAEFQEWLDTLRDGAELCAQVEARLNANRVFADTPWVPSELSHAVRAFVGCDNSPEDFDSLRALLSPG